MNNAKKKPLLSICIPTFNRAKYLDKCFSSIVNQDTYSLGDIEIVVSDNASTDDTESVVKKFQEKYRNIVYSKNLENVRDVNFPIAISIANGVFRKLYNDTSVFTDKSLSIIINSVKDNISQKPVLCFLNGNNQLIRDNYCLLTNFDEFVETVSYWSTWIGLFGIWEEDFNLLQNKNSGCELSLWQTFTLFEMIQKKKRTVINNIKLVELQLVEKKDLSYGVFKVFGINYLSLYKPHLEANDLSNKVFTNEKKRLLFNFFSIWLFEYEINRDKFLLNQKENPNLILSSIYGHSGYYRLFKIKMYLRILYVKIKKRMYRVIEKLMGVNIEH